MCSWLLYLLWLMVEAMLLIYRCDRHLHEGLDPLTGSTNFPVAGHLVSALTRNDSPFIKPTARKPAMEYVDQKEDETGRDQEENSCIENEEDSDFICDQLQKNEWTG